MRFNLNARPVRCPHRRPSTSLSNAFRPLLDELRAAISSHLRRAARPPRPQPVAVPLPMVMCWQPGCDGLKPSPCSPCPKCGCNEPLF
jgi:hypothetical protein